MRSFSAAAYWARGGPVAPLAQRRPEVRLVVGHNFVVGRLAVYRLEGQRPVGSALIAHIFVRFGLEAQVVRPVLRQKLGQPLRRF